MSNEIIEQTELSDSTVRRTLRKFLQDKKLKLLIIMKNRQIKNIN